MESSNIFLKSADFIKVGDFGSAFDQSETAKANTIIGTIDYMSPEMKDKISYSYNTDIWYF